MTNTQSAPDLDTLKAELQWYIANSAGPRTESTLMWALSLVEEIELERKVIEEAEREVGA